jgi:3-hydroxyacyl-[acyl-carrier-protein] dehydratase
MPPPALIEPDSIDTTKVLVDQEGIRRINPQRFEMEHLSAIILIDEQQKLIVGYKDVRDDEFWVRGHMPNYPLLPGILMCEAAAQICSYYSCHVKLIDDGYFIGFGGMEDVRFRGQVRPGQRLLVAAKAVRLNRRQTTFDTQGFVDGNMVFHARIIGVAIPDPAFRS